MGSLAQTNMPSAQGKLRNIYRGRILNPLMGRSLGISSMENLSPSLKRLPRVGRTLFVMGPPLWLSQWHATYLMICWKSILPIRLLQSWRWQHSASSGLGWAPIARRRTTIVHLFAKITQGLVYPRTQLQSCCNHWVKTIKDGSSFISWGLSASWMNTMLPLTVR